MSERLRQRLAGVRAEGRPALVVYLTFADPDPQTSLAAVQAACDAGADVIELGVPFSDPSADGPVIQAAMERALAAGGGLVSALEAVGELRRRGVTTPIVLFGYANPIIVMGAEVFAARAAAAGVDACLTVDVPVDELDELRGPLRAHGLDVIPLLAPTSTPARVARVGRLGAPFVYYISMTGVTGGQVAAAGLDAGALRTLRAAVEAPLMIGFGVRTAADARAIAVHGDGVVVGSAIVARLAADGPRGVGTLVTELAGALRGPGH